VGSLRSPHGLLTERGHPVRSDGGAIGFSSVDAEEYVSFIRDQKLEPLATAGWYDGLTEATMSLDPIPERSLVIPDQDSSG